MRNVLIVEDDPMVALINKNYVKLIKNLNYVGCSIEEDEIIEILKKKNIDLIILDVYLPKKNGLELLKSLRNKGYLVDVIMVTAANKADDIKTAFAYGAVDYLVKPFEFERFSEAINKYLIKSNVLNEDDVIAQEKIDNLSSCTNTIHSEELPKGLQKKTLDKILGILNSLQGEIWTISELSSKSGISNVTIKKYMDYLENIKKVESRPVYGNIGRPEYKYVFCE
ncbi:response regulator [Clostridium hydrogenum]|uniref:response regulator n=1 Tax=Clostridium hydrogenum TaxID=2855764 RepID=UPI001F283845|nr:response regulator [Clostridium hydrogenum]